MPTARILIFDSGVGGLSILQEIQQHNHYEFSYVADNGYFPYGTKEEAPLVERIIHVLQQTQQRVQADIIVIACNTASTIALSRIRKCFKQPVIGVVPAIKPAAAITQTNTIGLLGTPATIKRQYTDQLINDFAQHCEVVRVGSSELVSLAEQKLQGHSITPQVLKTVVEPLQRCDIDTLVLACTHFPLLKTELQTILPNIRHWVDSGEAIARRVEHWVKELSLSAQVVSEACKITGYLTHHNPDETMEKTLAGFGISTIKYLK